jgi:osmotically-inducible protein OsmY
MKVIRPLIILTIVSALCGALSLTAQTTKLSDANIRDKVDEEMLLQMEVPANAIDTETSEGMVTLTGTVNNLLARKRAEKVAMAVRGVRGVVNLIEVSPEPRDDLALANDIKKALRDQSATESYEVSVAVNKGNVILSGTVESRAEKRLSEQVAAGVKGVKSIQNEITIEYELDRNDNEIVQKVRKAIQNDLRLYPKLIMVKAEDGHVLLSGSVGSLNEKRLAESYAWTTGVKSVQTDALHVQDWADNENLRDRQHAVRSDAKIREAVKLAFLYDPRVYSFNPEVTVQDGIVTLRGIVSNLGAKRAAESDAQNVTGVKYVRNNLKVRPSFIPKKEVLKKQIEAALLRDPEIERYEVDVNVWDGEVTLRGEVDNYLEKYRAEGIVQDLKGVVSVINALDVTDPSGTTFFSVTEFDDFFPMPFVAPRSDFRQMLTDQQIEKNISEELWWSPFVERNEVTVEVDQGVATLKGEVDSWRERRAAVENAHEGGAVSVIDKMNVR